jgi:tetratricopeptide (TPR) repeat protein
VALGLASLQADKPEAAGPFLERVRLNGPQSNKALLGFGWAYASVKNHKQALVPWTELADRDASDSAVLEASIALPYAYGQLGAFGQALDRYNAAIDLFERENKGLDESIGAKALAYQFSSRLAHCTRSSGIDEQSLHPVGHGLDIADRH